MASLKKFLDRRRNPWKAVFYDAFKQWKRDDGQKKLEQYCDLREGAVVFDMGGYRGDWTATVLDQQPSANVHVFEPHQQFAKNIAARFAHNQNVHVHELALGQESGIFRLSDAGDASSARSDHDTTVEAQIVAVRQFFRDHDIPVIDLMKINIEGGEYELLPALIDSDLLQNISRLQVQFHLFEPGAIEQRNLIRSRLEATHDCVWSYPFVWEEWRLKN